MDSLCFTSPLFEIEAGEDRRTNPRRYGKQLATWLRDGLLAQGYDVEDPVAEDWGWCVVCQRKPLMLWVGCGNAEMPEPGRGRQDIVWMCFVAAEIPILKRLLARADGMSAKSKLQGDLVRLLEAEPGIRMVECP